MNTWGKKNQQRDRRVQKPVDNLCPAEGGTGATEQRWDEHPASTRRNTTDASVHML